MPETVTGMYQGTYESETASREYFEDIQPGMSVKAS